MRFGIIRESAEDQTTIEDKKQVAPEPLGRDRFDEIEARLNYFFVDRGWLERALTHRSAQAKGEKNDYERLEFLGDAVLDLAVAHLLLDQHPHAHEGELSKMRAALVNTTSLAAIARELELGKFIRLSRSELLSGGADRPSILADVLEAVMGAVYREGGFDVAYACVKRIVGNQLLTVTPRDPKTELQEALHARGSQPPVYKLECVEGPEHQPAFISIVEVDGQVLGRGRGTTKKASQQAAAEEALGHLKPSEVVESGVSVKPESENGEENSEEGSSEGGADDSRS